MGHWRTVRRVATVILLLLAAVEIFACDANASARVDFHNRYGTFFSPRLSALLRKGA